MSFISGMTGVATINYGTPQENVFFGNAATAELTISGVTPVNGLSSLNLANLAPSTISAPLAPGNSFAVTETNAGYLTISGGITGNGSTAISFRAPATKGNAPGQNTISTGAIGNGSAADAIASISNDGSSFLTVSSAINNGSANNLTLDNTSWGLSSDTGVITAKNLSIVGGNGIHGIAIASSAGFGGLNSGRDEVDLVGTADKRSAATPASPTPRCTWITPLPPATTPRSIPPAI